MRNKDIEKWEKRRAAKKIPKKAKKLTPTWAHYATLGLMVLWNFVGGGGHRVFNYWIGFPLDSSNIHVDLGSDQLRCTNPWAGG